MKYYVGIQGREFEIMLKDTGKGLEGELDGRRCQVNYAEIEENSKYSIIIDGESFNVSLYQSSQGMDLIMGGHLYRADVLDEREKGARALEKERGLKGHQVVQSVMPGIVIKVFVSEGDPVSVGDPLLILEAMKMENELCAESDGTVKKVHVSKGQTVNSSDPLVTLDGM